MISIIHMFFLLFLSQACTGSYSAFTSAGEGAETIANLSKWLFGGAAIIWVIFTGILIYSLIRPRQHDPRSTGLFIIGGGVIVPTIILSVLLYFSLSPLPELLKPAPKESLEIEVSGLQWWWRVRYLKKDGTYAESANEIRLPVDEAVQFYLTSEDVIHSFWIPPLGGKMDMIPGRRTMLTLRPTRIGTFSGVCAEYCGTSHALMKLKAVVMEKSKFNEWLNKQDSPAATPKNSLALKGQGLFLKHGCTACHNVKGLNAAGVVGPDLTHVGGRLSLGADTLPNDLQSFHRWITKVDEIKPGAQMPAFSMLPVEDVRAMATWLKELQ